MPKIRLDQHLVAQGLAESRAKAQALIKAGLVFQANEKLHKASLWIDDAATITVQGDIHPYVSRAGMKLAHALEYFALDVSGCIALDVGASTGGFTDVLLQAGAYKVFAVDVGYDQIDSALRHDPRVVVLEKTNARDLTSVQIIEAPDIVVCDASFISLKKILPACLSLTKADARLIALIKPQFEAGKAEVSRGKGIIRDAKIHTQVCDDIAQWITTIGWKVHGVEKSPITGSKGNVEFLLYAMKGN